MAVAGQELHGQAELRHGCTVVGGGQDRVSGGKKKGAGGVQIGCIARGQGADIGAGFHQVGRGGDEGFGTQGEQAAAFCVEVRGHRVGGEYFTQHSRAGEPGCGDHQRMRETAAQQWQAQLQRAEHIRCCGLRLGCRAEQRQRAGALRAGQCHGQRNRAAQRVTHEDGAGDAACVQEIPQHGRLGFQMRRAVIVARGIAAARAIQRDDVKAVRQQGKHGIGEVVQVAGQPVDQHHGGGVRGAGFDEVDVAARDCLEGTGRGQRGHGLAGQDAGPQRTGREKGEEGEKQGHAGLFDIAGHHAGVGWLCQAGAWRRCGHHGVTKSSP